MIIFVACIFTLITVLGSLGENSSLEQPRTFHIMFDHYFYINETLHITKSSPDIQIDLYVNYPRGFLAVDDPIKISGKATAYTVVTQNITNIAINFLGTQAYPEIQDNNGITQGISLNLARVPNSTKFVGNTTMVWKLEGNYYPRLYITGYPNKESPIRYYETNDIAVTVYPKFERAQIVMNKAVLWLTIVADIIAIIGGLSLFNTKKSSN